MENNKDKKSSLSSSESRQYKINISECIVKSCDGKLIERSYYERNNWVTVEVQCEICNKLFTVKVEY